MSGVPERAEERVWSSQESELHPHSPSGPTGGQFVSAKSAGSNSSAVKSAAKAAAKPAAKAPAKAAPKPAPKPAAKATTGPYKGLTLSAKAKNDPASVRQLQQLLGGLKLGNVAVDGQFGPSTTAAVMAAQQKLGLKPTGHATPSLIHQMQAAQALSPCGKSSGRSVVVGEIRAVPYPFDERADSSKPYGDVTYADPGYQDDGQARYPIDSEEHVKSAWSYINQSDNAAKYTSKQLDVIKARIQVAGKKYGIEFADDSEPDNDADDMGRSARLAVCTRSYEFEIRSVSRDGRRLQGRVAVFNTRTRIPDRGGDFDEEMMPGFADRSLRSGYPVMQFDHGKDPRVGTVPIGRYDTFDRRSGGYDVEGDLFDNPVVEPVRQAIQAGAIKGMSFRMQVKKDKWERRGRGETDVRQVMDADVPEAGPVVFPAYRDTTVSVRSILSTFDDEERAEMIRELREQAGLATDLTDFAGRSDTWGADGGENDDESWEDEASRNNRLRDRIYRTQMLTHL